MGRVCYRPSCPVIGQVVMINLNKSCVGNLGCELKTFDLKSYNLLTALWSLESNQSHEICILVKAGTINRIIN